MNGDSTGGTGHDHVPPPGSGRRSLLLPSFLVLSIVAVYWPVFKYPFVQDDWIILHRLTFQNTLDYLLQAISPVGRVFYRPMGEIAFFVVHVFFGENPVGFHVVGIALHVATSIMLVRLLLHLNIGIVVAWSSAWLYACSATIHLEPLLWLVGLYELIAAVCVVGALLAFRTRRYTLSYLLFLIGLLTKEAAIVTFPVLVLLVVLFPRDGDRFAAGLRRLLPHLVILVAYIILKIVETSPLQLPVEHPYAIRLAGSHIKENVLSYAAWSVEAMLPFKLLDHAAGTASLHVAAAAILIVVGFVLIVINRNKKDHSTAFVFLAGWTVVGILPVVFLPQQLYKYYLTYSWMPMAAMMLLLTVEYGAALLLKRHVVRYVFIAFSCANVLGSAVYVLEKDGQGYLEGKISHSRGGENHLIRKGSIVRIVMEEVKALHPEFPSGSVLVFMGLDIRVFGGYCGPQVWYHDSTITVNEAGDILRTPEGILILQRGGAEKEFIGSNLTVLRFSSGSLHDVDLNALPPPAGAPD
jgi:hypothetical protein